MEENPINSIFTDTRYRQFIELSNEGIWMVDANWKTTLVNPRLCELLGYSESEMIGMDLLDFYYPEDHHLVISRIERREHGENMRISVRYRRNDGSPLLADISTKPIFSEAGQFEGAMAIVVDRSEAIAAQEALHSSEERFRLLAKATSDILWEWSVNNDKTWYQEGFKEMTGIEPSSETASIQAWRERIHPDDREAVQLSMHLSLCGSSDNWSETYRFRKADGTYATVHDRGFIVRDRYGAPIKMVGGMTDISEKVRLQQDLDANLARLETASKMIGLGFWEANLGNCSVSVTAETSHLFGLKHSANGRRFQEMFRLVHPDDKNHVRFVIKETIRTGDPYSVEFRIASTNGKFRWVAAHGCAVPRQGDRPAHATGIIYCIDSRKRLEEHLLQAQKMEAIGRLTGGIAHDFNNILNAIMGNAQLAQMTLAEDNPVSEFLNEIVSATNKASEISHQLLTFARKNEIAPIAININEAARDVQGILLRLLGSKIEFRTCLSPAPLRSQIDIGQFQQVLVNLCVNARDAMPFGGALHVSTESVVLKDSNVDVAPGQYVVVTVRDSGHGMTPDVLPHIFEPFFTTKPAGQGTGLGLSTSLGIIQQAGGFMHVESKPNDGSTFKIYLPEKTTIESQLDPTVASYRPSFCDPESDAGNFLGGPIC